MAKKSPDPPAKTLQNKSFEKFSKCFSRLEVLLTNWAAKIFVYPSQLNLPLANKSPKFWAASLQLWHVTWLTCDWVAKIGQKWFLKFSVFEEQNTFQKHLKHSKIFLCLNQQRLSMWKHISLSIITQMNMTFIEHKLVCCVWISTMR